jgi:hypothetical protein
MCVNSESVSSEIDEIELQYEKHPEQRIWTWEEIVIDLIGRPRNVRSAIPLTNSVAASDGTKTEEWIMMWRLELTSSSKTDPVATADPRETCSLRPATTKGVSDILTKWRNYFWETYENWELRTARPNVPPPLPLPPGFISYQLSITAVDCRVWAADRRGVFKSISWAGCSSEWKKNIESSAPTSPDSSNMETENADMSVGIAIRYRE